MSTTKTKQAIAPSPTPSDACPRCGYRPDAANGWAEHGFGTSGNIRFAICLNCGEVMTFDPSVETPPPFCSGGRWDDEKTPPPVHEPMVPTGMDFARLSPMQCKRLLKIQSITYRARIARGYDLGKLRLRGGNA